MARESFHCPWTLPGMRRFSGGSGMAGGDAQDAAKGARAAPAPAASSPAQHSLRVWEHWDTRREKLWMEPSTLREIQGFKYVLKKFPVC